MKQAQSRPTMATVSVCNRDLYNLQNTKVWSASRVEKCQYISVLLDLTWSPEWKLPQHTHYLLSSTRCISPKNPAGFEWFRAKGSWQEKANKKEIVMSINCRSLVVTYIRGKCKARLHMRFSMRLYVRNLPQATPQGFFVVYDCDKAPPS